MPETQRTPRVLSAGTIVGDRVKNVAGDWPDMADERWGAGIHAYYGVSPYWDDRSAHRRAIG